MLPWSVIAAAGMPRRLASPSSSLTRAAPSSIEYSVCTWRCTNESDTPSPLYVLAPAVRRSRLRWLSCDDPGDSSRPVRQKRGGSRGSGSLGERLDHHRGRAEPRLLGVRLEVLVLDRRADLQRRVVRHD